MLANNDRIFTFGRGISLMVNREHKQQHAYRQHDSRCVHVTKPLTDYISVYCGSKWNEEMVIFIIHFTWSSWVFNPSNCGRDNSVRFTAMLTIEWGEENFRVNRTQLEGLLTMILYFKKHYSTVKKTRKSQVNCKKSNNSNTL